MPWWTRSITFTCIAIRCAWLRSDTSSKPMKLGKHPPQRDPLAHLKAPVMARFLSETAPSIPDEFDWMSGISDWGMMRNDTVGCCTFAGLGHAIQAMSAATESKYTVPDSTVIQGYSA